MKLRPRPFTRALPTALAIAASAALIGACGSDDDPESTGEAPTDAPASAEFPEPNGTVDELIDEVGRTDQIVALPSGVIFTPGDDRFGFGLFDVGGEQITDADAAIYAAHGPSGQARGPYPARIESLKTEPEFVAQTTAPDDAKVVFVSDLKFKKKGEWRLAAVVRQADGYVATPISTSIVVDDYKDIPEPGEPATKVDTPTLDEVGGDVESIDTRVPPSSMHGDNLADVLGKEPVVLLFATPQLCVSRVCGPVVDVAEQVKSEYGDEAAFIHMEIYKNNELDPKNLRPQVEAYGLQTEPWLFVIDENGKVTTRIEGAFSASELERALKPLVS